MSTNDFAKQNEEELLENNQGLVYKIVKRFGFTTNNYEDLIQAGLMGLYKAIKKFEATKGVAFSTYACQYIIGAIKDELYQSNLVKIPKKHQKIQSLIKNSNQTWDDLVNESGYTKEDIVIAYNNIENIVFVEDENIFCDHQSHESEQISVITSDKLSKFEEKIIELRIKYHYTQKKIASIVGLSQSQISRILKNKLLTI